MTFCSSGTFFVKKKFEQKFEQNIFGPNLCQAKSGVVSFSMVTVVGVGVKNQCCSEWPETRFGFGIFEI